MRHSRVARGACRLGYYAFVGLGAALMAATWVMSVLALRACAAASWCEARR